MCKCSRHIDLVRTYTDTNPAEDNAKGAGKMFSEDTVAVLLMALGSVSISSDQYKMMSALDGTKTASSFQHSCRSVLKKAKELKARVDNGEVFVPVSAGTSRGPYKRGTCRTFLSCIGYY